MLISLISILLLTYFTPYLDPRVDAVSWAAQVATLLTLLGGAALKGSQVLTLAVTLSPATVSASALTLALTLAPALALTLIMAFRSQGPECDCNTFLGIVSVALPIVNMLPLVAIVYLIASTVTDLYAS